ncbi:hypothetical protein C8R45DRAFT_929432 [Mycena sanguinolenta]|nr:hypothetical protein C8R45DRAFT_929432 [Mycena sanguinolenta]
MCSAQTRELLHNALRNRDDAVIGLGPGAKDEDVVAATEARRLTDSIGDPDLLKKQNEQVDRLYEALKPKPLSIDDTLRACFSELPKKQGEQADTLYEALKPKPPSTNDTLGACFSDLLTKQDEQGDRLYKAVEGLKAKAPAIDEKTAFWNAYKTLADEHDKDFQQRYGTDLAPTQSLLYISLGSTLLASLLAVLGKQWLMYYSAADERGTIEARGLALQRKFAASADGI